MNTRGFLAIIVFSLLGLPCAFAHGRSQEMIDMLNAPPPEWLTIGKPIVVEPGDGGPDDPATFRPLSGGARNTRARVKIPSRGIEIRFDYEISWYYGSSLSPDGTKLIVNSGMRSRLYGIFPDGSYREEEILLPYVTYDPGMKGFITGWSWAGDDILLGRSTITDDRGHEIVEKRIYAFHMKERMMSRFDVSALNLPEGEIFDVAGVGKDLSHLKLSVDGKEFTVKADLATPPEPMRIGRAGSSAPGSPERRPPLSVRTHPPGEPNPDGHTPARTPWLVIALVVATSGLLWRLFRKREA